MSTCKGACLSPPHKKGNLDAYRSELMVILSQITVVMAICMLNNTIQSIITIGCDVSSSQKVAQYYHKSHPIDKANSDIRKGMVKIRKFLVIYHYIKIKCEDIAGH